MNKRGFTLIELLVVIAIIGILATLGFASYNSVQKKGRDTIRVSDVKQVMTALTLYLNDKNAFPIADGIVLGSNSYQILCDTDTGFQADNSGCSTVYMNHIPANEGAGGSDYTYTSTDGEDYTVTFTLEGRVGSLEAGLHTATQAGF